MKFDLIYRRLLLGKKFKHQYRCDPNFNLVREDDFCNVFFKNQLVAKIPLAQTLSKKLNGSCFIVATGPSLKEIDLNLFSQHDTISLNCAIRKFQENNVKPTHCIATDRRVFENHWECIRDSILSGANCFFSYIGISRICERDPDLLKLGNVYLIESISRKFGIPRPSVENCKKTFRNDPEIFLDSDHLNLCRSIGFSSSLEKGIFPGKTVATMAVQLAINLGYDKNFIMGMDLGGTGIRYFYNTPQNTGPNFVKDYEPHIRVCFELARHVCDSMNIQIYNLSKNS